MEVSSPPGNPIGYIEQEWSIFPKFKVKDVSGNVILKIEGPFFPCSCCGTDVNFEVIQIRFILALFEIFNVFLLFKRYFQATVLKKSERYRSSGPEY